MYVGVSFASAYYDVLKQQRDGICRFFGANSTFSFSDGDEIVATRYSLLQLLRIAVVFVELRILVLLPISLFWFQPIFHSHRPRVD